MLYRHALGEVLRELRTEKGWTLRITAQKSTLALGYLSEIERGQKEVSSELLDCLTTALGYQTHEVVVMAGYRLSGIPNTAQELIDEYGDLIGHGH